MQKHSQTSTPRQPQNYLPQKLVIAASVALSIGGLSLMSNGATRFQFQQRIGDQVLSGVFEGSDQNANGILELSELQAFQANWGNYSWTKEDLEAFVWGEKQTAQTQKQTYSMRGLNLFARGQTTQNQTTQDQLVPHQAFPQLQVLKIWNQAITTPEGEEKRQGVQGIEYGGNLSDSTLFSEPSLNLEVKAIGPGTNLSPQILITLMIMGGLLGFSTLYPQANRGVQTSCSHFCSDHDS
ncbi:MAG: hypothetical protein HC835_12820 [Oscillatoriales cyanobacterium RM2_1_1]|nr:hypothetical protein [Oscillatoriales cyanobacterium SM2_3_0]NJO46431.1 hypothetical protein [Oscillatoriales cyanobacterium RM2_1_1]